MTTFKVLCRGASPIGSTSKYLVPRNDKQRKYVQLLSAPKPYIVVATGSAGTGKTAFATSMGVQMLKREEVSKLVITRPAVSVDEQHGFLPGTLEKKMEPWTRPIFDVLTKHYPRTKIDAMIQQQIIEICPLAYMRGRTFENSWIICDEAQNMTVNQMMMVLTRIGNNSKMVITGDLKQFDRGFDSNGLFDLIQRIDYNKSIVDYHSEFDAEAFSEDNMNIDIVEFNEEDVERHPVIPYILKLYK
jgi:phosphate starvation-inducible protein PhoH and related proteins